MKLAIQTERHSEILMEVIPVFEGGEVQHVCNSCAARVQRFVKFGTFSGKLGSTYKFTKEKDLGYIKEEVYVGLGKKEELTPEKIRFAVAKAIKEVMKLHKESLKSMGTPSIPSTMTRLQHKNQKRRAKRKEQAKLGASMMVQDSSSQVPSQSTAPSCRSPILHPIFLRAHTTF